MFLTVIASLQLLLAGPIAQAPADTATSPTGQEPSNIAQLVSFRSFGGLFSLGGGAVRIVALVSPTCPVCQEGLAGIADIMQRHPSNRLRAYVVIEPMREGDSVFAMLKMAGRYRDRRVAYLWDPDRILARAYGPIVGLDNKGADTEWDAYFLYGPRARFLGEAPTAPDLSMHQHEHVEGPELDFAAFEARLAELLARLEDERRANHE